MANYIHAAQSGPYVQDKRYIMQYYSLDRQKEALNNRGENSDVALSNKMKNFTLIGNEFTEYSNLYNKIKKYRDE